MTVIKIKIWCLVVAMFGVLFETSYAGITQICNCHYDSNTCPTGQTKNGYCTLNNKKSPRCCSSSGVDDGCSLKSKCDPNEYQQDSTASGYTCCPRKKGSQWPGYQQSLW